MMELITLHLTLLVQLNLNLDLGQDRDLNRDRDRDRDRDLNRKIKRNKIIQFDFHLSFLYFELYFWLLLNFQIVYF